FLTDAVGDLDAPGGAADQRHSLDVGSIGIAGFQAETCELIRQVSHRQLLLPGSRRTPLEFIRGQRANMAHQIVRGDARNRVRAVRASRSGQNLPDHCRRGGADTEWEWAFGHLPGWFNNLAS